MALPSVSDTSRSSSWIDLGDRASLSRRHAFEIALLPQVRPGGKSEVTMFVGNVKSAAAGASNGEYIMSNLAPADIAAGWSVDAPKGAVPAGDRKQVKFTFSPPKQQPPSSLVHLGMPEWKELNLEVQLKGGAPSCAKVVKLVVRCFLEPMLPGTEEDEAMSAAAQPFAAGKPPKGGKKK